MGASSQRCTRRAGGSPARHRRLAAVVRRRLEPRSASSARRTRPCGSAADVERDHRADRRATAEARRPGSGPRACSRACPSASGSRGGPLGPARTAVERGPRRSRSCLVGLDRSTLQATIVPGWRTLNGSAAAVGVDLKAGHAADRLAMRRRAGCRPGVGQAGFGTCGVAPRRSRRPAPPRRRPRHERQCDRRARAGEREDQPTP